MSLSELSSPLIGCRGRRLLLLAVALLYTCQLPTVAQDCGQDWCLGLYCTYGRAYDDNGCPLCDCLRPCENVTCPAGESCEVVPVSPAPDCASRSGCPRHLGRCTVTTTRSPCPIVDCTGVYCRYGYVSDVNGCRTCQCRDLCERLTCPPGQVCKVTPDDCEPGQECRDGPMPYCAEIQESSTSTAAAPSTSTTSSSSYSSTRPTSPDVARSSTSTSTTTSAFTTTMPSSSTTTLAPSTTTTPKPPSTTTSTYTTRTTTRSTTSTSTTPTTTTPSTTSRTSSSTTTTTTVPAATSTTTVQTTTTSRKPVPVATPSTTISSSAGSSTTSPSTTVPTTTPSTTTTTTSTTAVPPTTSSTTVKTTSTTRKPVPPTSSTTTVPTTTSTLPTTTTSKSATSSTVPSTTTSKLSTPPSSTSTTTTVRTSSSTTTRHSSPALQTTTSRTESTARCPVFDCVVPDCPYGRVLDSQGCATCTCNQPCQEVSCPAGQTCKVTDNDDTPYCDADNQLLEGIIRIDASYSIIDDMADFKQKMKQQIGSYLRVSSEHIIVTKVTKGSIVVYFGVDQQTDTSLEDVLARLERMNSTGIVITYVERTYDGRLVGFTATPDDSTGAPSRQSDNYTFTLIVVLACVLGPLIIVIIIITIVILVVHKRSKGQVAISNRYQELRSVSVDSHTETGGTNNVSYVVDLDRSDRRKSDLETFA